MEQQVADSKPVSDNSTAPENQTSPQLVIDQPMLSSITSKKKPVFLSIILAVVALLVVGGYFAVSVFKNDARNKALEVADNDTSITQVTPTSKAVPTTELISYISKLGIQLDHTSKQTIKEVGRKIYISDTSDFSDGDYSNGQSVEVFDKDPKISFKEAIETQLLKNVDKKTCWVEISSLGNGFERAEIAHSRLGDLDAPETANIMKTCGADYAQTNGMRYFSYDSKHPDKFLFFNIGQYAINVGENVWQNTVIFVSK